MKARDILTQVCVVLFSVMLTIYLMIEALAISWVEFNR